VDALATVLSFRAQDCIELNPAMRWLLDRGEVPFVLAKIAITGLVLVWICKRWGGARSRLALLAGHSIYVPIVLIHIVTRVMPGASGWHG
jgi:hypothetical protein